MFLKSMGISHAAVWCSFIVSEDQNLPCNQVGFAKRTSSQERVSVQYPFIIH